jgi:sugar phosphate isomerase/epimerase
MGLYDHKRDFLDRLGSRLIGIHLHDVTGVDDHRAPLMGSFDFSILKPYIKKDTLLVLEPHYPAAPDEIIRGAEHISKLFGV